MDWLKIMALYLVISVIGGSALMSLFLLCMRLGAGIFWNSVSVTIQNNLKSGAITLAMLSAFPYMVALIINLDEWGSVKWSRKPKIFLRQKNNLLHSSNPVKRGFFIAKI